MKKTLITFALIIMSSCVTLAQVIPNGNFELGYKPDSTIPNWVNFGSILIGINDSFLYDNPLVGLSTNANGGNYALELRTAYNVTQNHVYELQIGCNGDSTLFFALPNFPINNKPSHLSLYYSIKEFPTSAFTDTTICTVKIMNSDFIEIGGASVNLWQKNSWYLFKKFPIQYLALADISQGDSIPAFAHISFKHAVSTSIPHIGHRILIDDLSFTNEPTSTKNVTSIKTSKAFPNPMQDLLKIEGDDIQHVELINALGQTVYASENITPIQATTFQRGLYFLKISHQNEVEILELMKE
jgi:hypothetical protein